MWKIKCVLRQSTFMSKNEHFQTGNEELEGK